jgi:hypothetical protein
MSIVFTDNCRDRISLEKYSQYNFFPLAKIWSKNLMVIGYYNIDYAILARIY